MSVDAEAVCKILGRNTKYECTVALTDLTDTTSPLPFCYRELDREYRIRVEREDSRGAKWLYLGSD